MNVQVENSFLGLEKKETYFEVKCGDWIFTKDVYPDLPGIINKIKFGEGDVLILDIFSQKKHKISADPKNISDHLTGPRYLECKINWNFGVLYILNLKNSQEENFRQGVMDVIKFKVYNLFDENIQKINSYQVINACPNDSMLSVVFTSIILQSFLDNQKTRFSDSFKIIKKDDIGWLWSKRSFLLLLLFFKNFL